MRETLAPYTAVTRGLLRVCALGACAVAAPLWADAPADQLAARDTASVGPVRDLGVSEVSGYEAGILQMSTGYEEILPASWEGRGLSAAEVLATLPGIQYYKQGGMGSFQTVSVRGIAARSIVICIDGVPLNDATGGAVNLGQIDLNQMEKIEVYKDRVPVRFGGSGIGGAINFVTKAAVHSGGRVLASYGSHNTFEGSAQVTARPSDSTLFSASLSARHSDNDYSFKNRNGTKYNEDDDFWDRRSNSQYTDYSGHFQYRMLHGGDYFSVVSGNIFYAAGGIPGTETNNTKVANFVNENAVLSYRLETPDYFDMLRFETGLSGKFEKTVSSTSYPLDHLGYLNVPFFQYGLAGYKAIPEVSAYMNFSNMELGAHVLGSGEYYGSRGSISDFEIKRLSGTLAGEASWWCLPWLNVGGEGSTLFIHDDIEGEEFVLPNGSNKLDGGKSRDMAWSGMLRLKLGPENSRYGFNASFGRFFREPQLMELYGAYEGLLSNPELKDETAHRFEASAFAMTPSRKTVFRTSYFETHSKNGIYWIISGEIKKPLNVGRALIRGVEAELQSRPVKFFETTLRATVQDPRDNSDHPTYDGKLLPGEPVHSYFAEGRVLLPLHLDASFAAEYRTKMYGDRANRIEQPPTPGYNAALGFSPLEKTRLTFAVNNISDETYRNIFTPYPITGREWRLTLTQGL